MYVKDLVATISPDVKRLVRFEKKGLKPGETKTIEFTIDKQDMSYVNFSNEWEIEAGDFEILVGGDPTSLMLKKLYYKKK